MAGRPSEIAPHAPSIWQWVGAAGTVVHFTQTKRALRMDFCGVLG